MSSAPVPPTDADLLLAKDSWSDEDWKKHFATINVEPSPVRYDPNNNDVLRFALHKVQKRRCWLEGTPSCRSRSLLLSEAEIDHVVPRKATAGQLRDGLARTVYQRTFFDVDDPGNLGIACHTCNREKGTWTLSYPWPMLTKRIEQIEKDRGKVIRAWQDWHRMAKVDDATLRALTGVGLDDPDTREFYAEIAATMVIKLAAANGAPSPLERYDTVDVQTSSYRLSVGPSDDVIEWAAESYMEMLDDERRAEERYGDI